MVDEKTLLSQCVELANNVIKKNLKAVISIKIGKEFNFSFDNNENSFKKKSPSQAKRDLERNENFKLKNVKEEVIGTTLDAEEENKSYAIEKEALEIPKKKKLKFKIAAHMQSAAQSVLKSAVLSKVSYDLAQKVKWDRPNSQFDVTEKVDGIFSGIHIFEVEINKEENLDENLKKLRENWKLGQFPSKLMEIWMD